MVPPFITSGRVRRVYGYWCGKLLGREFPLRDDIDPGEFKDLLPDVALTELYEQPLRVRFRLAGSRFCEIFKREVTGLWLHEVEMIGGHEFWLGIYRRLIDERRPLFGRRCG